MAGPVDTSTADSATDGDLTAGPRNRSTGERGAPRPMRGPFARWPRIADAVLAVVVFGIAVISASAASVDSDEFAVEVIGDLHIAAYGILAVSSFALFLRRRHPIAVLAVALSALALWGILDHPDSADPALLIALYGVGRYVTDDRRSYLCVGFSVALVGIGSATDGETAATVTASVALFTWLPWYIGTRIRIRGAYVAILRERTEHLQREQQAEAVRAVNEERARIARELHDVVAHRVSMMTVQAGAAKTVALDHPREAAEAMGAVEHAGRQALGELRYLLGVLRPGADPDGLGPQPGLADVGQLVEQLDATGMDTTLDAEDVPTDLPGPVDLSAYRIAQEALTNVLKHAGPAARATVRLGSDDDLLTVEVIDTGTGDGGLPGSGYGIAGMRERATLLGGTLDTGPLPAGGFRVVARLPIRREAP